MFLRKGHIPRGLVGILSGGFVGAAVPAYDCTIPLGAYNPAAKLLDRDSLFQAISTKWRLPDTVCCFSNGYTTSCHSERSLARFFAPD